VLAKKYGVKLSSEINSFLVDIVEDEGYPMTLAGYVQDRVYYFSMRVTLFIGVFFHEYTVGDMRMLQGSRATRSHYSRDPIDLELPPGKMLYMFWLPHLQNALDMPKMLRVLEEKQAACRVLAARMSPKNQSMMNLISNTPINFGKKMTVDKRAKTYKTLRDWAASGLLEEIKMTNGMPRKEARSVTSTGEISMVMMRGEKKLLEVWRMTDSLETMVRCAGTEAGQQIVEEEMRGL
jgi:hypothetical protein